MAKISFDKIDKYSECSNTEKFKKKKPSNASKKHIKKESKHKSEIIWENNDVD